MSETTTLYMVHGRFSNKLALVSVEAKETPKTYVVEKWSYPFGQRILNDEMTYKGIAPTAQEAIGLALTNNKKIIERRKRDLEIAQEDREQILALAEDMGITLEENE